METLGIILAVLVLLIGVGLGGALVNYFKNKKIIKLNESIAIYDRHYERILAENEALEKDLEKVRIRYENIQKKTTDIKSKIGGITNPVDLCDIANRKYSNSGESDSTDIIEGDYEVSDSTD